MFKYNWDFLDQLLLPYKFHGSDMWEILFSIFASCEPLIIHVLVTWGTKWLEIVKKCLKFDSLSSWAVLVACKLIRNTDWVGICFCFVFCLFVCFCLCFSLTILFWVMPMNSVDSKTGIDWWHVGSLVKNESYSSAQCYIPTIMYHM